MNGKTPCNLSALKALFDGELDKDGREKVLGHLLNCDPCRKRYERITVLSELTAQALRTQKYRTDSEDTLVTTSNTQEISVSEIDVDQAFQRWVVRVADEPEENDWHQLLNEPGNEEVNRAVNKNNVIRFGDFKVPYVTDTQDRLGAITKPSGRRKFMRRIGTSVAALAICAGLFATGLGNRALADMFQTFYVQDIVALNPQDVALLGNEVQRALTDGHGNVNLEKYGQIRVSGGEIPSKMSLSKAQQLVNYKIPNLPEAGVDSVVQVTAERNVSLRLNVAEINALLKQLGANSGFPPSVNNQPILLNFPPEVEQTVTVENKSVNLFVSKVPSIQVPDGVDINSIRQKILEMPFVPQDMKIQLAATDWQNTAFVPFPNGTVENVTVNGFPAVLHTADSLRLVLWIKDGKLFELKGNLTAFPSDSAILQSAGKVMS